MFVLIAGGGRTGAQLAKLLVGQNHEVHLIESRKELLARLHRELPTETIYEGNAADIQVLESAGIARASVVAACGPEDADNLAMCFLARTRYNVPRTIAAVNNPGNAWLYDQKFHVDVAFNRADILASLIEEEMSLGDMMTLLKLRRGKFSLVEMKIPERARVAGMAIQDIVLPPQSVIAAVIRHSEIVVPRGDTRFEVGDEVLAVVGTESAEALARLLEARK